ncbi:DUF4440 domain-containing protein [Devosia chinhatensis]|uniref:DUF4440 domain-containing protein n=1 Tax=Devosia chinhatensis TaxID=429727 RepID=A0A0F5FN85_9HYPH|nr:DUF4440 domain-containing protein [Devosia chinhatensis]KKB10354.1 hypothetical protein VE26_07625 [Devosia chinhatensis]
MHELWKIERGLWLDGAEAYRARMADSCLMVFGPTGILDRDRILAALEAAPRWRDVELSEMALTTPGDSVAVVLAYKARARRDDGEDYQALCSSTYLVLEGEVKLVQHQQTPL